MLEKTFSQKAARVFEIVAYLLIVPAIAYLILSFFYVLIGLIAIYKDYQPFQILALLISLTPLLVFSIGIILLVGYFKHSRGTLGENKIIPLWLGTFFYTLPPLSAVIYQIIIMPKDFHNLDF